MVVGWGGGVRYKMNVFDDKTLLSHQNNKQKMFHW